MKKDLLFGAADNYTWDQIRPWVKSIRESGFDGDVVLLVYRGNTQEIAQRANEFEVTVINTDFDMWGNRIEHDARNRDTQSHQMRFWHLVEFLDDVAIELYQHIICTDVRDVIFQRNPSEFLQLRIDRASDSTILAPSEGLRYCHEAWGAGNLREGFGPLLWPRVENYEIFNVGTIAGSAKAIRDLALVLYTMGEGRFIPNDQSSFNLLVNSNLLDVDRIGHDEGWACQCGTMADPQKIDAFRPNLLTPEPVVDDGLVYTSTGDLFYLVHQYDRVPGLAEQITRKYA